MLGSVLLGALIAVGSDRADIAKLSPSSAWELSISAARARSELTCKGLSRANAGKRFDRRYGSRLNRVNRWYRVHFSDAQLAAAVDPNFVIVGGCPTKRGTRPSEDSFIAELEKTEAAIAAYRSEKS